MPSKLSMNAFRALRLDTQINYTHNQETGHKILIGCELPGDTFASRLITNSMKVLWGYVTYRHILLRSPRLAWFYR